MLSEESSLAGMPSPDVSLMIMAKNEEENMPSVLEEISAVMRGPLQFSYELFLVDGYSEDNTVGIAEQFGIKAVKVMGGKGAGIREGLAMARGKYALFIDADKSHVAADILNLLKAIQEQNCDMVIASRILGGSEELGGHHWDDLLRLSGNRLGTLIVNWRWGSKLTDVQNGFRIIRRDTALELGLEEDTFAIEQEMVMKCLKRKKKIAEIPSFERKRLYGKSKIRKRKEFWRYLRCFLKHL
jgi:glycosyltransferase involved in cell wall biosynthesis